MAEAIKGRGAQNSGLKKAIGNWAKSVGLQYYRNAQIGYEQRDKVSMHIEYKCTVNESTDKV